MTKISDRQFKVLLKYLIKLSPDDVESFLVEITKEYVKEGVGFAQKFTYDKKFLERVLESARARKA
ncbi:MAG: hypothetical protein Q8P81_03690 [Nanoarchaeota archaeon]|nr:hypothetical protein [Nanoarchaeota archaeon]